MAIATTTSTTTTTTTNRPTKLVCFSFASYARTLIDRLRSSGVRVLQGLTDPEFTSLESLLSISFPPDLRSILQEGVPVGPGFPDWRTSSKQQLQILTSLPRLTLLKLVSKNDFWCASWGERPSTAAEAVALAERLTEKAPALVPVYRNCYVASMPCMAGNPVFYVNDGDVRVLSFDLAGFFQDMEFTQKGALRQRPGPRADSPAWAATAARKIEFWSEAVEAGQLMATEGWWSRDGKLGEVLDEAFWRLRDGGWRTEEVREMMMMDGWDGGKKSSGAREAVRDMDGVVLQARLLARELLRGGWCREDVVDSFEALPLDLDEESWLDYEQPEKRDGAGAMPVRSDSDGGGNAKVLRHLQSFQTWLPKAQLPRHPGN